MISFIEAPLLTKKTMKKVDKIISNINKRKYISNVCLISFSENEDDVFEIIPVVNFRFKLYENKDIQVIGITENKKAAVKMCARLSEEYIRNKSAISMKEYFKEILL